MAQLAIKNLSKLAPLAGGPWNLPHKFHLCLIIKKCSLSKDPINNIFVFLFKYTSYGVCSLHFNLPSTHLKLKRKVIYSFNFRKSKLFTILISIFNLHKLATGWPWHILAVLFLHQIWAIQVSLWIELFNLIQIKNDAPITKD